MGFKVGAYATVWGVEDKGKFSNVRISTSRKNQNGEYETDFSGFVRFIGEAHKAAPSLKEKDRIKLGDVEVTNSYDKETKKVAYTNYALFSFEMADASNSVKKDPPAEKKSSAKPTAKKSADPDEDSDLPF